MKCTQHPKKEVIGVCVECGRGVCTDCIIKSQDKTYCKECANKLRNYEEQNNTYIVCEKCGGFYELKNGESLEDFESCECGGKLKAVKKINNKAQQSKTDQNHKNIKERFSTNSERIINFKAISIGTITVLILSILFSALLNGNILISYVLNTSYIPFTFLAAIITSYIVGKNLKNGIINGIISGLIATIISLFLINYTLNAPFSSDLVDTLINTTLQSFNLMFSITTPLITISIGALAGFLGTYLKIGAYNKNGVKIQWKFIIIGLIIAIILSSIINMSSMSWGGYLAIIIASIFVGYIAEKDYKMSIIYGAVIGAVAALIFGLISIMAGFKGYGLGEVALTALLTVNAMIIAGITGAISGTIGVIIKR